MWSGGDRELNERRLMSEPLSSRLPLRGQALYQALCVCVLLSAASQVWAAPKLSQETTLVPQEQAFPVSKDFYPATEPDRDVKLWAERVLGLYLVDPPRRHASERVDFSNNHLHFHLWRPIGERSMVELWSEAAAWLVFGRIKYSSGARGLFSDLDGLERVTVSLHEVIRPGQEGRRKSKEPDQVKIFLTISLKRADFERLDLQALQTCSTNRDCNRAMRSSFSLVKLNSRYIKRRAR